MEIEQQRGYGLCLEDPVRLTSIPLEYVYLSCIISPAGTPFVASGTRFTCKGMVDCHCGHYLDGEGKEVKVHIYVSAYNRENDIRPPDGWTMKEMQVPKQNKGVAHKEKQGCLIPFALMLGSLVAACFALCVII